MTRLKSVAPTRIKRNQFPTKTSKIANQVTLLMHSHRAMRLFIGLLFMTSFFLIGCNRGQPDNEEVPPLVLETVVSPKTVIAPTTSEQAFDSELSDDDLLYKLQFGDLFNTELIKGASHQYEPVLADFDNDGDLDIALIAPKGDWVETTHMLYIYENERANFSLWQTVPMTFRRNEDCFCNQISLVDINLDGYIDVMVSIENVATLLLNEEGIISAEAVWQSPRQSFNIKIAWGDVDNDGDDDLALSDADVISLYMNNDGVLDQTARWESESVGRVQSWADVNNDGWLDVVAAEPASLYLNQNGTLTASSQWTIEEDVAHSLSYWHDTLLVEDFDGNGWLDFVLYAVTDSEYAIDEVSVYYNAGGLPETEATDHFNLSGIFYGSFHSADIDNDGDYDLVVSSKSPVVYYNNEGVFDQIASMVNDHVPDAHSIAFGDLDNNGSLDMVTDGQNPTIYLSNRLSFSALASLPIDPQGCQVELGDMNNDDQLEMAIEDSDGRLRLYSPVHEVETLLWESRAAVTIKSFGWVDIDSDGDLDLSATTGVYHNQDGELEDKPSTWMPSHADVIVWADINQDGWADLFLHQGSTSLHLNEGGVLNPEPVWELQENAYTLWDGLALDDIDSDGDLDLTLAVLNPDRLDSKLLIFENDAGELQTEPQQSLPATWIHALDWADVDGDGDLDLALADAGLLRLFLMEEGRLSASSWQISIDDMTDHLEWFDVDDDGDLDLVEANLSDVRPQMNVFANHNGMLDPEPHWSANFLDEIFDYDLGDLNRDGMLDLVVMRCNDLQEPVAIYYGEGVHLPATNGSASLRIDGVEFASYDMHTSVLPITYTLTHPAGEPFRAVQAFYSLNGGGDWQPAIATSETITRNLPLDGTEATYVFHWDVDASYFFGSSDSVVVRIEALPSFKSSPRLGGITSLLGSVSGQTAPMRVSGSQVLVTRDGDPVKGAMVYRLAADSAEIVAQPITTLDGQPLRTMANGLLEGRDTLRVGDRLMALHPISATRAYTLYHSSAMPTVAGVAMHEVSDLGVQELTISADNPLMLFNFDISLEWDARSDPDFLSQLHTDIHRTSEILFDLSNGQAALGDVTVYHAKERWYSADVVIYADNRHRPNANLGGIVDRPRDDVMKTGEVIENAILPGQIRIGANWNRYGEPVGTIGEDWPRVLAHEIGHYAFFQLDNYLGRDPETGLLNLTDCRGSVMTDSYRQDYTEFLSRDRNGNGYAWDDSCENTLAQQSTGRSDWETIRTFYPFLNESMTTVDGPRTLPLDVTHFAIAAHDSYPLPLVDEFFYLLDASGNALAVPDANAYLIQTQQTITPTDDQIVPLGAPVGQLVRARGVKAGDLVCTYTTEVAGCASVQADDRRLTLAPTSGWQAEVDIRPSISQTLQISVTVANLSEVSEQLFVQIYPHGHATETIESLVAPLVRGEDGIFSAELAFPSPVFSGHARVWSDADRAHETLTSFAWIPGWDGYHLVSWGGYHLVSWGGYHLVSWGGHHVSGWGSHTNNVWNAPLASSDGQVMLFDVEDIFSRHSSVLLQSVKNNTLPAWLTPVGTVYRYLDDNTVSHTTAIQFRYLGRHLPTIDESLLTIYFRPEGSATWQPLPTTVDTTRNMAISKLLGNGLYALVATVELPAFDAGWNIFSYPLRESRTPAEAFASIEEAYTRVEELDPRTGDPLEGEVERLEFGRIYRINIIRPTTLYLRPPQ
ncbi:MAG: FG-GAP-like repeat-containing protein [Candidatus Promineifilaceae bacterium]